jgi:hypothetical protein
MAYSFWKVSEFCNRYFVFTGGVFTSVYWFIAYMLNMQSSPACIMWFIVGCPYLGFSSAVLPPGITFLIWGDDSPAK